MIKYNDFVDLGGRVFGPLYAGFIRWIYEKRNHSPQIKLLFLSREGFHLKRLYEKHLEIIGEGDHEIRYLEVSRAILYRISLAGQQISCKGLDKKFYGTFKDLLVNRFSFSEDEISLIKPDLINCPIELPGDKDFACELLRLVSSDIIEFSKASKVAYIDYLASLGIRPGDEVFVVDIGFSGTIQKLLTEEIGLKTRGLYLYRAKDFYGNVKNRDLCSGEGYFFNDAAFGIGNCLVDWSLVQESIFTAPVGQLRDIKKNDDEAFSFVRGSALKVQENFHITYAITDGIVKYLAANYEAECDLLNVVDFQKIYELTLKYDMSHPMKYLRSLVEIDDAISGFGNIRPFDFLPGLKA